MIKKASGFTIVELLIVIVVIGILAAVSIVAYNSMNDKARWASTNSALSNINRAIQAYHSLHGSYPVSANWRHSCNVGSTGDEFIPGISSISGPFQQAPCKAASAIDDSWIYRSDGTNYKLLYLRPANFESQSANVPVSMRDPVRWNAAVPYSFGYWTPGFANL